MAWGGRWRYAVVGLAAVAVVGGFAVLYGWLPWWIDGARLRALAPKDQAGILSSDRGDVLKMVAGAGALFALVYTARKHALERKAHDLDRQAFALSEQGQVTDRYTKAITQLASDKASERIGGIYALERIMADSERDHPTVVEVLAAFVRQRAPLATSGAENEAVAQSVGSKVSLPEADVQAAVTVLARRPERKEPFALDLRRCMLAEIEFPPGARLAGASLGEANLAQAELSGADLTGANLTKADLTGAYLAGAILIDASLGGANLTDAELFRADLTSAYFWRANLTGAKLADAKLLGSRALHAPQLQGAGLCTDTELSPGLRSHPWVTARIEDCKDWILYDTVPPPTPDPAG